MQVPSSVGHPSLAVPGFIVLKVDYIIPDHLCIVLVENYTGIRTGLLCLGEDPISPVSLRIYVYRVFFGIVTRIKGVVTNLLQNIHFPFSKGL